MHCSQWPSARSPATKLCNKLTALRRQRLHGEVPGRRRKKYEQKSAEEFAAQRAAMAQQGIPCKRRGVKGNRIGGETPVCDTASYWLSEPAGSGLCEDALIDAGEYTWTAQAAHIIGEGSNAVVYLGLHVPTKQPVAVKVYR